MLTAVLKLSYKPDSLKKHKSIWQRQYCVNGVVSHKAKMDAPMDRAVTKVDGSLPQLTITQATITWMISYNGVESSPVHLLNSPQRR